jgi:hypothetical protein
MSNRFTDVLFKLRYLYKHLTVTYTVEKHY